MSKRRKPCFVRQLHADKTALEAVRKLVMEGYNDAYIQNEVNTRFSADWAIDTIRRARRRMGFHKKANGGFEATAVPQTNPLATPEENSLTALPPNDLSESEKAHWFRKQFKRSHLFAELQRQFGTDEVMQYLEEYGRVCCQFADIVTSEFFQIDDFLKHRLLINRALREQSEIRDELEEMRKWLDENPTDEDDDPKTKKRRLEHVRSLESMRTAMVRTNERYDKLVAARDKIYSGLSATRRDRVEQLKNAGTTFFNLVASILQDASIRDEQGRYAELTRAAAVDVVDEWHKPAVFPDGSTEPILMDGSQDMMPGQEDDR